MKRKTLKRALAGISAIAMIGTSLPASLLASAVSYNGIGNDLKTGTGSEKGYGYLYDSILAEKNNNDKKSPLVPTKVENVNAAANKMDAATLKDFTFMLKKYEKYNVANKNEANLDNEDWVIQPTDVPGETPKEALVGYVAKEWNIEAAKDDVKKLLNGKDGTGDVLDVTFYDDADDEQYGCDAYGKKNDIEKSENFIENRYGKIKTITLNMPVNTGKGGAGDITFKPVEFTVARTARDVKESTSTTSEHTGLILVNYINLANGTEADINSVTDGDVTTNVQAAFAAYKAQLLASAKADIIKAIDEKIATLNKSKEIKKEVTDATTDTEIGKAVKAIADDVNASSVGVFTNVTVGSDKHKVLIGLLGEMTDNSGMSDWLTNMTDFSSDGTTEREFYYEIIKKLTAKAGNPAIDVLTGGDDNNGGTADLWEDDGSVANSIWGLTANSWGTRHLAAGKVLDDTNNPTQLFYNNDVDIFLNGYNLITSKGIQVNGSKLRVWGTNEEQDIVSDLDYAGKNTDAHNAIISLNSNTASATLTAFAKDSSIELYDDVYVENQESSALAKSVVEGNEGTFIMCGDAVVLKHNASSVGVINTNKLDFEMGDYTYYKYDTDGGGEGKNDDFIAGELLDTKAKIVAEEKIYTYKNHMYNKYGLEVNARPEDPDSNPGKKFIADSTDYTDTNARTPEINYGFQPAYKNNYYDQSLNGVGYNKGVSPGGVSVDNDYTYTYTPAATDYATANEYVNIAGAPVANANIYVTNLGQLMWLNANLPTLMSTSYNVTVKIDPKTDSLGKLTDTSVIDFDDAPKSLVWNAVDLSGADTGKLTIDGEVTGVALSPQDGATKYTTNKKAVIKNMRIASEKGDAGIFSKTKSGSDTVTVKNVGFEQPVVEAQESGAYAGVIAGVGSSVNIENVYVAEPTVKATYKGAFAGVLNSASKIKNTFSYGAYDPAYAITDNATRSNLVANNTRKTEWYSNIFANDYPNFNNGKPNGTSNTYFKAATVEQFNNGTVAFMLNKHDPEMEMDATKTVPIAWDNGNNGLATVNTSGDGGKSSVDNWACGKKTTDTGVVNITTPYSSQSPWYQGLYQDDIFGQALGSDKSAYPTFLVGARDTSAIIENVTIAAKADATNRVYRQITKQCSGQRENWTADNAVYANVEVYLVGGHKDTTKNGRCDECGAYEIKNSKNFDPVLWPGLRDVALSGDDTDANFITLNKIGDMEAVTFDLRKGVTTSTKTISDIMNIVLKQKANGTHDLTGFDLLSKSYTDGTELSATNPKYIKTINFNVDDKIACTLGTDDYAEKGFEVFSMPYTGADLFAALVDTTGSNVINSSMVALADDDEQKVKGTEVHYYVAADKIKNSGSDIRRANTATFKLHTSDSSTNVAKIDGLATGYKAQQVYTFQIKFSALQHYGSSDFKNGLCNEAQFAQGAIVSGDTLTNTGDKIRGKNPAAYHTEYGTNAACGCIIKEEEHDATFAITNAGHFGTCTKTCGYATSYSGGVSDAIWGTDSDGSTNSSKYEEHKFEALYTFGNMVFERCQICNYSTLRKDTDVMAKSQTPELSIVVDDDGNNLYRQTYQFDVSAGKDGDEIVSYGVVYRTDGQKLDNVKLSSYLSKDGTGLDAAKLTEKGLSFTRKTSITNTGTYTVNKSLADPDALYSVVGYLITDNDGTKNVYQTVALSSTFRAAADKEVQESCAIEGTVEKYTNASGATGDKFSYRMELSNGCQAKTVGNIFSKVKGYSVTDKTTLANVDDTNIKKKEASNPKPNAVIVNLKNHQILRVAGVKTTAIGYMVVTNEKYGDLEFEVYSEAVTQAD